MVGHRVPARLACPRARGTARSALRRTRTTCTTACSATPTPPGHTRRPGGASSLQLLINLPGKAGRGRTLPCHRICSVLAFMATARAARPFAHVVFASRLFVLRSEESSCTAVPHAQCSSPGAGHRRRLALDSMAALDTQQGEPRLGPISRREEAAEAHGDARVRWTHVSNRC